MLDNAVLHGNYMTNITSNSQNNIWCCCCPLLPPERGGKYLLLKAPQKHRLGRTELSGLEANPLGLPLRVLEGDMQNGKGESDA